MNQSEAELYRKFVGREVIIKSAGDGVPSIFVGSHAHIVSFNQEGWFILVPDPQFHDLVKMHSKAKQLQLVPLR